MAVLIFAAKPFDFQSCARGAGIDATMVKNPSLELEWRYDLLAHLPVAGLAYRLK